MTENCLQMNCESDNKEALKTTVEKYKIPEKNQRSRG